MSEQNITMDDAWNMASHQIDFLDGKFGMRPNPEHCCLACVFGHGEPHTAGCTKGDSNASEKR